MATIRTVLVIEDEAMLQVLLYEMLSDEGYRVLQAYDGVHGYHLASTDRPHLVILDFGLPLQSGADVLVRLKDGDDTRRIPVIAVTGQPALFGSGPLPLDAWLPKPVDFDELLAQVDRLADWPPPFVQAPRAARLAQVTACDEKG